MWISKIHYRACLGGLLSLTLVGSISLSSFAASEAVDTTEDAITDSLLVSQGPTGTLTTKGPVDVNGNPAQSGATITSGTVIQTRTGGHAIIELGAPGRVDLDPITAITLSMTTSSIQATLDKCGEGVTLNLASGVTGLVRIVHISDVGVLKTDREVKVRVYQGEALVRYGQGKEKTIKAGDQKEFDNAIEVTATGGAIFKVYCDENHYPLVLWAGLAGIFIPVADVVSGNGPLAPVLSTLGP
jgi:hypothetical protein